MSTAALDALQDVTGLRGAGQSSSGGAGPAGAPSGGAAAGMDGVASVMLVPGKLDLYQSVIQQLRDDGLVDEARMLSQRLNLQPPQQAQRDSLYSLYELQSELERSSKNTSGRPWVSMRPRPLPPIGPQEELLDLREFRSMPTLPDNEEDDVDMENGDGDIIDELAAVQRVQPPQFRTRYTAQHKQGVRSVAFSADGRLCASGSMDTSIKIMDTSKMRMFGLVSGAARRAETGMPMDELRPVIRTFYDHVGTVTSLAFHPRQPILFTGSVDKTVKLFDLTRGGINKKAMCSISDVAAVSVVAPLPCGDFVLVGTQHPVIRLYDVNTQQCFSSYWQPSGATTRHKGGITDLKPASDGSVFASASSDGNVLFWDGVSNRVINQLSGIHNTHPVTSVQWSRNNRYVLTGGGDHRARLWDVRTGKQLQVYAGQPKSTSCTGMVASFAHSEDLIIVASSECGGSDCTLIDARTGSVLTQAMGLVQPGVQVTCIATNPTDKTTILTGADDFKVRYVELTATASGLAVEGDDAIDNEAYE